MAATMLIPLHHVKSKSVGECLNRSIDYVRDSRKTEDENTSAPMAVIPIP